MMNSELINQRLEKILEQYQQSFINKTFQDESLEEDDLMLVYGLTQTMKSENRQYWGRELGMCWQLLVTELCQQRCQNFSNAIKEANDEICDLIVNQDAIDTKYRIGSGDSGTLKKFRHYAQKLMKLGYRPVLLILRNDSLSHALKSCQNGGWKIIQGDESYEYIYELTNFDLKTWLQNKKNHLAIIQDK